jgi:hypothetical protein
VDGVPIGPRDDHSGAIMESVLVDNLAAGLFVVAGLLLASMGGAVFAAPVTLPLMYLAVRHHPTRPFRLAGGAVAALTAVELAWAVVYFAGGEEQPSIWLLPLLAGLGVLALFATARRRERALRAAPGSRRPRR